MSPSRELFVQDLHAGADPAHRLKVRVITEQAWHSLFARNMFIRPPPRRAGRVRARLDGPAAAEPRGPARARRHQLGHRDRGRLRQAPGPDRRHRLCRRDQEVDLHRPQLPAAGRRRHADALLGQCRRRTGGSAVFFGLSGTGKTTLSADAGRTLIGDDEHGWGQDGVFNFEGGCYAKVIRLDPDAEPEIFAASTRFGAILENVALDPATARAATSTTTSLTENTRSCYPLDFIPNASTTGRAGHPSDIVMLTADAFGVLPPISLLSRRAGDVPLPLRLHRPRRRHRARRHRAAGHLLDLLRRAVHAAPPQRLRRDAGRADRAPPRPAAGCSTPAGPAAATASASACRSRPPAPCSTPPSTAAWRGMPMSGPSRLRPAHAQRAAPDVDRGLLDPRATWADRAAYDAGGARAGRRGSRTTSTRFAPVRARARSRPPAIRAAAEPEARRRRRRRR